MRSSAARRCAVILCMALIVALAALASSTSGLPGGVRSALAAGIRARDPLTDLPVDASKAHRPLLAVMVENTPDARPQSGLDAAGVVIETVVEGRVTRFMALFAGTDAGVIGPIRSTRQYFASWAYGFGAWLAHAYAKPSGYETIRRLRVMSLDAVRAPLRPDLYFRTPTRKRPHNLYGSTAGIRTYALEKKRFASDPARSLWPFKGDAPRASRGEAHTILVNHSNKRYAAAFHYDPVENHYLREMADVPHETGSVLATSPSAEVLHGAMHTAESVTRLSPRNVIVLVTSWKRLDPESPILEMRVTGRGLAIYFRDGLREEGSWDRLDERDPIRFLDVDGEPVAMNRGQSWIVVVRDEGAIEERPGD